ncbi:efflux RND transporter periplasmic adaptor subunit [Pigmentiphaga aceris]|uniref:Efflux RND transporter periplasmic adaptor subunit n=1 Tax=Pigmentiphaga aceris TaxID=1940612 RepID=A0A5C0B0K6_9BURK|nr:efflux RND transporter periplasmic adaptor subunit [Pigmentiphaga aceris]QEI08148.1 efflux RND transporter periplasmic adaptor subunit [Pigmentiphaga aceris]
MKLKPVSVLLILAAVAAAVFVGMKFLPSSPPGPTPPAATPAAPAGNPSLTVATVLPQRVQLPITLGANGNIVAWQEAVLGSEANGLRLKEVRVNVGDTVKAGQVLAVFASETVMAEVAQARAAVAEANANASDAAANATRAQSLQRTGALSVQQINQYQTTADTARARVESAKATLDAQQLRLVQTRVLAPDDGVISSRTATVGSVVGVGTELFRMIRKGRLEWRAEVISTELGRLGAGTKVQVTAPSGASLEGTVRMIAPTVDPQTRNALVYVDLPVSADSTMPVKAGMFAHGEFVLGTSAAVTVPQQSVLLRDGFSYVFHLRDRTGDTGHVVQAKVRTGRRLGDQVEIVEGLPADAHVVVRGAAFLTDGDLVRITDDAAASGAAGSASPAAAPAPISTTTPALPVAKP